jgi:YesN/AraC family two-component response regulator
LIREFNIEESQTSKTVRLKDVLIKGKPEAGNWHDFTILTENPLPEKASGFFIVSLTHPSYKYSHRGNKGGAYVSSMNTVFNISISSGNEIALFEKTDENSLKSRRLSSSTVGQTMDFRKGKFRLERAKGKIRFRAKIPEKAIPGEWILSAYGEWEDGRTTNIVRKKISVQASSGQNASYSIPILFLFIVTISGSVVVLLKTKKNKMSIDPEVNLQDQVFLLVCEYIRTNINKNVTLKDISMAHSLTFKATQEAIKRNGYKTLPALVNEIRMKKAEELLSLPNLSIAEISYSLGYDDPDYFSRVFRSFSGMKPTDYRKKITES